MEFRQPKISLLLLTYNRPHLLERAIKSVLNQTFQDFELVIVNNGSADETREVLTKYEKDDRIRIFHIEKNIGYAKGYNYAMDQIGGEWFALLGDDDEILEDTFETLLRVPEEVDSEISAVTCNSIDTTTGEFSGFGLDKDQYLPIDVIIGKTSGEFFGITKTELLGDKRLNAKLPGDENTFWYKIDAIANRYYIHKALKIWCTDASGTETAKFRALNIGIRKKLYLQLLEEEFYWDVLSKYNKKQFVARCLRGMFFLKIAGDKEGAGKYRRMLMDVYPNFKYRVLSNLVRGIPPWGLGQMYRFIGKFKFAGIASRFFFKKYSRISS